MCFLAVQVLLLWAAFAALFGFHSYLRLWARVGTMDWVVAQQQHHDDAARARSQAAQQQRRAAIAKKQAADAEKWSLKRGGGGASGSSSGGGHTAPVVSDVPGSGGSGVSSISLTPRPPKVAPKELPKESSKETKHVEEI